MTDADLAAKAAAQAQLLADWQARALARIEGKVDDARAHATTALTQTLRDTPDGRKTDLKLRQSRSYLAALERLDELYEALAGPSADSLGGLILDARAACYRQSLRLWWDLLPAEILRPGITTPTKANLTRVRRALLHNATPRQELAGPIDRAARALKAAINQAAMHGISRKTGGDTLGTWARQARDGLAAAVRVMLSDGLTLADRMAGRDCCDPELLEPDPTLPE